MPTTEDKIKYSTSLSLTITANSLASSTTVGRQSAAVDNSTNLYDDVLVTVSITTTTGTIASTKTVSVYVFGSEDGTNFDQDDATTGGGDAGYTINAATNLKLATVLSCPTAVKLYYSVFSIARLFGGVMPKKWGIVICNDTNLQLSTAGNGATYTGITYTNT
jgi:hypothetical protein